MSKVQDLWLVVEETMVSYDITSLFLCIPTFEALETGNDSCNTVF